MIVALMNLESRGDKYKTQIVWIFHSSAQGRTSTRQHFERTKHQGRRRRLLRVQSTS